MPDILHRVGIKSSPDEAYRALTAIDALSDWWTNDTQGQSKVGEVIRNMVAELDLTLALCGLTSVSGLDPECLAKN